MTSAITPNPGIHHVPSLDSGHFTLQDWQQLQAWGATLLTEIANWISLALNNISVLGLHPFAMLQAFGQQVSTVISQMESLIGVGGVLQFLDSVGRYDAEHLVGQLSTDVTAFAGDTIGVATFLETVATDLGSGALNNAVAVLKAIHDDISALATALGGIGSSFSSVLGDLASILSPALQFIGHVLQSIGGFISGLPWGIGAGFGGALSGWGATLISDATALTGDFSLWGSSITGTLTAMNTTLAAGLTAAAGAISDTATTAGTNAIQLGGLTGLSVASINQALQQSSVGAGGSGGGLFATINFSGYANQPTLAGIFTAGTATYSIGGPGGGSSQVAQIGITSGVAVWQSPSMAGHDLEYYSTPTTSDYQVVSMQLASTNNSPLSLVGRSNTTMGTCVVGYLDTNNNAVLACYVSGFYTEFVRVSHIPVVGAVYELVVGDKSVSNLYSLKLLCNGVVVASYLDVGHVSQIGSSNRFAGFGMKNNVVPAPGSLSAWGVADNAPPQAIGSGFRAYMSSGSIGVPAGIIPGSVWDTVEQNTGDLSYNATTGVITVRNAGWYAYTVRAVVSASTTAQMYKNGTQIAWGLYSSSDGATMLTGFDYFAAGDTIAAALGTSATVSPGGGTVGSATFFAVSLMNRGTLS